MNRHPGQSPSRLTRRALLGLAAAVAAVVGPARAAHAVTTEPYRARATGGGWLLDAGTGARVTFGFQVQRSIHPTDPPRGTVEFHNHLTGVRWHSNQISDFQTIEGDAHFTVSARISGLKAVTVGNNPTGGGDGPQPFSIEVTEGNAEARPFFSLREPAAEAVAGFVRGGSVKIDTEGEPSPR